MIRLFARRGRRIFAALRFGVVVATAALASGGHAQDRVLQTGDVEIERALRRSSIDIDDPNAVFRFVLDQLPERVKVYPTENYYYFRFLHNGAPFVGNIRLAVADRDQGKLHFSYGQEPSDWHAGTIARHVVFDASRGVTVERIDNLHYRVRFEGTNIVFMLNDFAAVRPPEVMLRANERYIGPVFDESGIRFFLVFNERRKLFHYLLDETEGVADQFDAPKANGSIRIGRRTGFAFYDDDGRKVLVGVNARASALNTPFDGPFDQLPENFIEGETLRDAILSVEPDLKGRIDRYGNFLDSGERFLIHPYMLYRHVSELAVFSRCVRQVRAALRPACFVIDDDQAQRRNPRPRALLRGR